MNQTIGILAHVDAGKTTLSEQILYRSGTIRHPGRVDHKNTFLDLDPLERNRGITIFSEQAVFEYHGNQYYLIDTPGHADFGAEMERAVQSMDIAVLVVSAADGIQSHTETIWRLLRRYRVPTVIFINKVDREGVDIAAIMAALKNRFSSKIASVDSFFSQNSMSTEELEVLAELDESFLDWFVQEQFEKENWLNHMRELFQQQELYPCFMGSALQGTGIDSLLQGIRFLSPGQRPFREEEFSGRVFKIRYDPQGTRLVFLKVCGGTLKVKQEVKAFDCNGKMHIEKINEIRIYNGSKFQPASCVEKGGICAVTGMKSVRPGDSLGKMTPSLLPKLVPLLTAKVEFDSHLPAKTILQCMRILEEEDPSLKVIWNETLQEIQLHVMGKIQLEILKELISRRFGFQVSFGSCQILYYETITKPVMGYGHFEPLRHYAEVHLLLEPLPRGSGIQFESRCPLEQLDASYQHLVRTHVFEKEHKGILTCMPLTDVRIVLTNGKAHLKHTEGGDFREAVYRAIRQGLEQAQNILLEPYYSFTIFFPPECIGRVLSDIQARSGSFEPPAVGEYQAVIKGRGPVAAFMNYAAELESFTKGYGSMQTSFDGYEPCHNQKEVIEQIGYDKTRDTENTSSSIFCAKGAGYPVKWQDVPLFIHCKDETPRG